MTNRAWQDRRSTQWYSVMRKRRVRRFRHATRPGYGMGMGANTLIHKGGKP